ncbi:ANTAR domain-containing protein [Streptomyces sp. NPDC099050]|uniref:ANTAR domain-containing protein n=1 Tax=Streptomyces sp. NPDC099050 TaxID=3366100 RepID=UPI0038017126
MISDRMAEVLRGLERRDGTHQVADVTAAGAAALGVDALAVSLLTGDVTEPLWCSDETSQHFEDLQFTLGEGPGPDTLRSGAMVLVPDLAQVRPDRWAALAAESTPVRAVFCFPMGIGAISVGVLTAVRRTPGALTAHQVGDALVLAAALTARLLGNSEPHAGVPAPLDPPHTLQRAVVHQATGMLSVQLALTLPQALLRLRAHAYSSGRPITDVCQDVVERRLRLEHDDNGTPPPHAEKD